MTNLQPKSILIVDDNTTNIKVLLDILNNCKCYVARSGESALSKAHEVLPDLILLDIKLPGIDGFETCRRLKAEPKTKEIPVIFLSALDEAIDKVKAFGFGGVDYITKPFDSPEVLARVQTQLTIHGLNAQLEQQVRQRTAQLEATNQALLKSEEQFRQIFEQAPIGMALEGLDGQIERVNQALCETLGYTSQEMLHQTWADLIHPEDKTVLLAKKQDLCNIKISDFKIENRYLAKNGNIVYGILQVSLVRDSVDTLHLISQLIDITERKQMEEQLRHSGLHDPLTNLPNRTLLMQRLQEALKTAKLHPDYLFALLFIDLDRFKLVNDSFGHQVGDELLVAMALKLKKIVRETDTVARMGGDEFIILLDRIENIYDAIRIAELISKELKSPLQIEEREVYSNASIGIAISSTDYNQATDLLQNADIALYCAKENGKGRYEVFDREMHDKACERQQIENDLRQALELQQFKQQFKVYYQPIVCLSTGRLTGFEALIRWLHPTKGLIPPDRFIPIAEETGLIVPIGEWVLREATQQMSVWQTRFPFTKSLKISVNVSTKQIEEADLLEKIDEILAQTNLLGKSLNLELTESILMKNAEKFIDLLSLLKARGIEMSIDDFGTKYSCFEYLHRFSVHNLKADRSFVRRIGEQGNNKQIIETIVTLAHKLEMKAIAEGVETQEQLKQLVDLEYDEAQGYYFSPALEPKAAEAFMLKYQSEPDNFLLSLLASKTA